MIDYRGNIPTKKCANCGYEFILWDVSRWVYKRVRYNKTTYFHTYSCMCEYDNKHELRIGMNRKKNKYLRLNKNEIEQIYKLHNENKTYKEIADIVGTTYATVKRYCEII